MIDFLCPVCRTALKNDRKSFRCSNGHCFDIARKGYVNLLQSSSSGRHGDDRLMVNARTDFLNKGYYDRLSQAVVSTVLKNCPAHPCVIDAGCGDGKYTADLELALSGDEPDIIGLDISKYALEALSRRSKTIRTAVAGTSSMPVPDHCADILLNLFSPLFTEEFHRVLKTGGILVRVIPLEDHLFELKQAVYDHPYRNEIPENLSLPGFALQSQENIRYSIALEGQNDICSLFQMTPYYYKTGAADQQKLQALDRLTVHLEFGILTYAAV